MERVIEKILHKYENMIKTENEKKKRDEEIINYYFSICDDKIMLKENVSITKRETKIDKKEIADCSEIDEKFDDAMMNDISGSTDVKLRKQIFICSRTQTQLNQYFQELKKIEKKLQNEFQNNSPDKNIDRISINMIIIGSRKHLCINEDFLKRHKGVNELNDCCKSSYCKYKDIFNEQMIELMRKKKKNKIFYECSTAKNRDSSTSSSSSSSICDSSSVSNDIRKSRNGNEGIECIKNIDNYSLVTKLLNRKNINMNEIKEICKNEKIEICPYYLNRENVKNADIVLLPYICILNENIRQNLQINIKDNILIFDESQNIIENINDCNSTCIEYYQVFFCKLILNEYVKKYKTVLNNNNMIMIKQIIVYCNLLMSVFSEYAKQIPNNTSIPTITTKTTTTTTTNTAADTKGENLNYNKNENNKKETKYNWDWLTNYKNANRGISSETSTGISSGMSNRISTGISNENSNEISTGISKGISTGISNRFSTVIGNGNYVGKSTEFKEKENKVPRIINVNKFNILSKIDAVNLNSLSNFLNNSLFCRKIRIFAESYIHKHFKSFKNSPNFKTNSLTTSIYSLNEFTNTLIKTNKYDYVFISDVTTEMNNESDDGKETETEKRGNEKEEKIKGKIYTAEERNHKSSQSQVMKLPYPKHKRTQTYTYNEEQEKKRKKDVSKKEEKMNTKKEDTTKEIENEAGKDEIFFLLKQLFDDMINRKKELFHKIEIISVSSCNNFQKIVKECKNIILIGGTLYPLEEFLLLFLNEKKNKIKLFSADYIFKRGHIFSRIINRSIITNELIDNTFKNRYNKKHLLNLAIQIYILTLDTNYGNIVFFPSYKFLKVFTNFLNREGNYVLGKMMKKKYILFETKYDTTVLKEYTQHIKTIKEHDASLRIKNGCVLFCVMNAKLSEGLNFHDEYCRNIIIVGLPFFKYENKESNNQFVLDRNALVLEYYKNYSKDVTSSVEKPTSILGVEDVNRMCKTYQVKYAMKIVNQCIGRSMRHINDFSSFFFLDFRFSKKEIYENFPSFIKRHIDSIAELTIDKNDSFFFNLKQNFTDTYNDFKNYYDSNYAHLKFEQVDEKQLNMFIKDLYSLNQFHQRMNNF